LAPKGNPVAMKSAQEILVVARPVRN
jgi:hypothetical protein